ncbi:MAG: 4'-phosphopantetheinyl transferase superfamily protein [Flammeovirgaceae bacterium]|nr:4'-phosphopantetheinyl transferase superfamily protein [Flammeovirgaceae bacterium]
MPLIKIEKSPHRAWGIWKVTEDEESLKPMLKSREQIPVNIHHAVKRQEWFAGRILVQYLLHELGHSPTVIQKNNFGKPFIDRPQHFLSLTHSYPYVAAIIDSKQEVGIDLEQPKQKLLRVADRVFSDTELIDGGSELKKLCIYWCAKEALIKIYGEKHLSLKENLRIEPFQLQREGNIMGKIITDNTKRDVYLYYSVTSEFVIVLNV